MDASETRLDRTAVDLIVLADEMGRRLGRHPDAAIGDIRAADIARMLRMLTVALKTAKSQRKGAVIEGEM